MPIRYGRPGVGGLLFVALTLSLAPLPARAISNNTAHLALHLTPLTSRNQCLSNPPPCTNLVTNGALAPNNYYFAYLLVTHADRVAGVAGLKCGIVYNPLLHQGVDIFTWNLCATLEFSSTGWPNSGGGNLITWDSTNKCQRQEPAGTGTGVVAVAGYFYLGAYSADRMDVVRRPVDGLAEIADCSSQGYVLDSPLIQRTPYPLGSLAFSTGGLASGYNPCGDSGGNCLIAGPLAVTMNQAGIVFSALGALPGDQFAWSVTGNAAINGPTNGAQVTVDAGAQGTFQLDLDLTHAGSTSHCWTVVTVTPENCLIQGPETVIEGTTNTTYSVFDITPADGIHWSITGNGTITSATDGTSVTVSTDVPGTFVISVHSTDGNIACAKNVIVNGVPCTTTGPDDVPSYQVNLEYAAAYQLPGTTYAWSISGSGTLTGPTNGPVVHVTAGAPGTFLLNLSVTRSGQSRLCQRTINVYNSGHCTDTQTNARILVHLKSTTTRDPCGAWGSPTCADVNTAGALYPATYFGYLLVCDGSAFAGLAGVECGLQYDGGAQSGVDIYTWALCGSVEFHTADWPASGSGNRITWDPTSRCQRTEPGGPGTGVTANAGYFYLAAYTPDQLRIRPHPATGEAKVADCTACESILAHSIDGLYPNLGSANFSAGGNSAGYNPCGSVVPVMQTTWGSIKAYFKGADKAPR